MLSVLLLLSPGRCSPLHSSEPLKNSFPSLALWTWACRRMRLDGVTICVVIPLLSAGRLSCRSTSQLLCLLVVECWTWKHDCNFAWIKVRNKSTDSHIQLCELMPKLCASLLTKFFWIRWRSWCSDVNSRLVYSLLWQKALKVLCICLSELRPPSTWLLSLNKRPRRWLYVQKPAVKSS